MSRACVASLRKELNRANVCRKMFAQGEVHTSPALEPRSCSRQFNVWFFAVSSSPVPHCHSQLQSAWATAY